MSKTKFTRAQQKAIGKIADVVVILNALFFSRAEVEYLPHQVPGSFDVKFPEGARARIVFNKYYRWVLNMKAYEADPLLAISYAREIKEMAQLANMLNNLQSAHRQMIEMANPTGKTPIIHSS